MPTELPNTLTPQEKTLKIETVHPFLSNIESETLKVTDKNSDAEPKIDLALTIETDETTSVVFEVDKTSVQFNHILKLKSESSGLILTEAEKGLVTKPIPHANVILISTPQNSVDYFPLAGTNALLVASDSGWSLEDLGDCDQE